MMVYEFVQLFKEASLKTERMFFFKALYIIVIVILMVNSNPCVRGTENTKE